MCAGSRNRATVVMAAQGYPEEYATGHEITGIDQAIAAGCLVFQAGTKYKDNRLVTAGGTCAGGQCARPFGRARGPSRV